jgi:DNA-directed RNA polymerase specialized sigma24 family protein
MSTDELLIERLDEMVRLLAVIAKRSTRQVDLITELGAQGFAPKRIAELLGTTPNAVSVTLHKMRSSNKQKKK